MANSNFVVHNGLTVGPTTITASTGDINAASFTTPGNITASNAVITNVTVTGTLTGNVSATGNISASSVTATTATVSNIGTATPTSLTFFSNATPQATIDNRGNLTVVGSGLLGYGTGSGGNVVQATSKTTAVTLNKSAGRITTANTSMTTNQIMFFTLNNTQIGLDDVVIAHASGRNGAYFVTAVSANAGNANIRIVNTTAGTLAETVNINFAVIKTSQT
jgi:hypothetical protein